MQSRPSHHLINLFLGILSSLIIIEICSRFLYRFITPLNGRFIVSSLTGGINPNKDQVVQPHPYMLYVNTPNWERDGIKQTNSLGYRGNEISLIPQKNTVRILALGSSTTLSYPYVSQPSQSWINQLQNILNERSGKDNVEAINGGVNYATSAELLAHYLFRDRYLKSKIVVIHEGYNDTIPLMFNNYNPEYSHYRTGWSFPALRPGERYLLKLYSFRVLYSWWLNYVTLQKSLGQSQDWQNISPQVARDNVDKNEPEGFKRNIELLIRNILQDGGLPILFPVPLTPKDRVQELPEIAPLVLKYYDAFSIGLHKNSQVMNSLAAQYNIPYIEMPINTIPAEYYIDHIHLDERGEREKALFLANQIESIVKKYY